MSTETNPTPEGKKKKLTDKDTKRTGKQGIPSKLSILKGTIRDVVDMSNGIEFWIRLRKPYEEDDYNKYMGKEVEIHV